MINLCALLSEANLTGALPDDCPETLEDLQSLRLQSGRPALLARLKELGMARIGDRQALVKCLASASRQGRVATKLPAPVPVAPTVAPSSGKKVAFMFLIYDVIHHEDLWQAFLRGARLGDAQYSVYVHAKSRDAPLKHFEGCHLPRAEVVATEYAHISLVHAMNALLAHALADAANAKFVFLSGHCVPLKPFSHVYDALLSDDCSHFSAMDMLSANDQGLRRTLLTAAASAHLAAPPAAKAAQWCVLNRRLARLCVDAPPSYVQYFAAVRAPEEWFFLTTARWHSPEHRRDEDGDLGDLGDLGDDVHVVNSDASGNHKGPTFANWREQDYTPGGHRPRTYRAITIDELYALVHGPCLFARKFDAECTGLEPLRELISVGDALPTSAPQPPAVEMSSAGGHAHDVSLT